MFRFTDRDAQQIIAFGILIFLAAVGIGGCCMLISVADHLH